MYKFIVITKNNILKFLTYIIILSILIYMLFSIFSKDKLTFSFFTTNQPNDIVRDFDGDGINDTLTFSIHNNYYNLKIKTSYSEFPLTSITNNIDLIDANGSNNIKLDFIDLSRDSIPEIIITGNKNNKPITYIFSWNKSSFIESFCTEKNIFGVLNSKNTKTPFFLHTSSNKGDDNTEGAIFNNEKLKDITFSKPKIPSLSTVQNFIDLVQLTYELTETPGIFTPSIPSSELGMLWNLDKNSYRYNFQNGYFKDVEWTNLGDPYSLIWVLSFEKISYINSITPSNELILYVKVVLDELGEYKIDSIKK